MKHSILAILLCLSQIADACDYCGCCVSLVNTYRNAQIVVSDGDSITAIGTVTAPYPFTAVNAEATNLSDVAVSGQTCASRDAAYASTVAPLYNGAKLYNVATLLCGANDWTANTLPADSYASILSWVSKAKATGFTVIVCTGISRGNGPTLPNSNGQTGDQYTQALAALITAGAAGHGYTVADFNANATMGCTGCFSNPTYFQGGTPTNGLHETQAGAEIMGTIYKAALVGIGLKY